MKPVTIKVISGQDIRRLLSYPDCVDAVEAAMRRVSLGGALLPLRHGMPLPNGQGALGMMPGFLDEPARFGIKLVSLFPGNTARGLSTHLGVYVLYEAETGQPLAILEAGALTAIRTAAASVVATRALARPESRCLAIVGTGEQARAHIESFQAVRPFESIRIWGRDADRAQRLAHDCEGLGGARVTASTDLRAVLAEADVVCTVTSAREPLLTGGDLRPGMHLCLVGSSFPDRREVDDDCVARARFFVDYRESARAQAGELKHAIEAGRVTFEGHVVAEIGEVLAGQTAGRRSPDEVTIYKSLGVAAQDLAAAAVVHRRAVETGAGVDATL
jgi:ornithine cyclodeaminase/alanine dehydrogenase-like protein (mu-crystallin family)